VLFIPRRRRTGAPNRWCEEESSVLSVPSMSKKIGPNEPCPCSSGKKHKKCCGAVGVEALAAGASYDRIDRDSVYRMVADLVEYELSAWGDSEDEGGRDDKAGEPRATRSLEKRFWGEHAGRELPDSLLSSIPHSFWANVQAAFEDWVAFDVRLGSGARLVDQLLRRKNLRAGEHAFLEALKQSALRPYEVLETQPGVSLTLRDLLEGSITVAREPSIGLSPLTTDFLMARVLPYGVSGKPEIEGGVYLMPGSLRQLLLDKIVEHRGLHQLAHPGSSSLDADKELPPFFNQLWLNTQLSSLEAEAGGESGHFPPL
jgi:SEC-C motif